MGQRGGTPGIQRMFQRLPGLEMPRQILGADLADIAWETSMLGVFIVLYAGIALARFRQTLD